MTANKDVTVSAKRYQDKDYIEVIVNNGSRSEWSGIVCWMTCR